MQWGGGIVPGAVPPGRPQFARGCHATVNAGGGGYRRGAVSTRYRATGLLDADGYCHARETGTWAAANPAAVQAEIVAQVEQALAAGLDVTHLDTHMGTITHPRFIGGYLQTLMGYRLPGVIPCLFYTSPSPRDPTRSRMPYSA